jgi:hypothetical protein
VVVLVGHVEVLGGVDRDAARRVELRRRVGAVDEALAPAARDRRQVEPDPASVTTSPDGVTVRMRWL